MIETRQRGDFKSLYDIMAEAAPKTKATRPNMLCTSKEIFNESARCFSFGKSGNVNYVTFRFEYDYILVLVA